MMFDDRERTATTGHGGSGKGRHARSVSPYPGGCGARQEYRPVPRSSRSQPPTIAAHRLSRIVRAGSGRRPGWLATGLTWVLVALILLCSACAVKKMVPVTVPAGIREAKTATFEQLINLLGDRDRRVTSLSSNSLQVTFRSGRIESGRLQEYRSAPGYVLLKKPDSIRLNIQNPITKTTILDLLSVGDDFSIWYPRENKFFIGKNSAKEFDLEGSPSFTARPIHMFQAIMPESLPASSVDLRIAMEEEQDASSRYYVLTLLKVFNGSVLFPVRKLWIERAGFGVARQQTYGDGGSLAGIVYYSSLAPVDGIPLPLTIRMERPVDAYSLDLRFKTWHVNPDLPENAFTMAPPSGAQQIILKEKALGESGPAKPE